MNAGAMILPALLCLAYELGVVHVEGYRFPSEDRPIPYLSLGLGPGPGKDPLLRMVLAGNALSMVVIFS